MAANSRAHYADRDGQTDALVVALAGSRRGGDPILSELPVDQIAGHPDNPRGRDLGDLEQLAASIVSVGVLQPIVVAPAGEADGPDPAALWVVVAGTRRLAACQKAGLAGVPAIVRDDLSDRAAAAVATVVENIHRADLSPLAEARGYQLLVDLDVSQREIARRCGVSQAHVSKRLTLLRLPQQAQDDLGHNRLKLADALKLAELPAEHQEPTYAEACDRQANALVPIESTITHKSRQLEDARRTDQARRQAADEGIRLVDPAKQFGTAWYTHRLDTRADIDRAHKAGTLAAEPTPAGLVYYTTQRLRRDDTTAAADERARTEQRERRTAIQARTRACEQLVAKPPRQDDLVAVLAATIVHGRLEYARSLKLAHGWLRGKVGADVDDPYEWADSLQAADPAAKAHAAYAMTVANDELRARLEHSDWDAHTAAHLDRLITTVGYQPTPWEQARFDHHQRQEVPIREQPRTHSTAV